MDDSVAVNGKLLPLLLYATAAGHCAAAASIFASGLSGSGALVLVGRPARSL